MKHLFLCIGLFCGVSNAAGQAFDLNCHGIRNNDGKLSIRVNLANNTFVVDGNTGVTTYSNVDETKINFITRDSVGLEHVVNLNRVTGEALVGMRHNGELLSGRYFFYSCALAKPKF